MEYKTITNDKLLKHYPKIHYQLNKYYSIGLKKEDIEYQNYSGIINLNKQINEQIVKTNNYESKWTNGFIKKLSKKLGLDNIFSTTAGFVPNLSGVIRLEESFDKKIELHFYKSLINNYFTIEILEIDNFKEILHPILGSKKVIGINSISASPVGKYSKLFLEVYDTIINEYEGSKFIPYIFDLIKIEKLEVPFKNDLNVTIAGALFQKYSSFDNSINVMGDIEYKIKDL